MRQKSFDTIRYDTVRFNYILRRPGNGRSGERKRLTTIFISDQQIVLCLSLILSRLRRRPRSATKQQSDPLAAHGRGCAKEREAEQMTSMQVFSCYRSPLGRHRSCSLQRLSGGAHLTSSRATLMACLHTARYNRLLYPKTPTTHMSGLWVTAKHSVW